MCWTGLEMHLLKLLVLGAWNLPTAVNFKKTSPNTQHVSRAWPPANSTAETAEMENHQDFKGISIFAHSKTLILDCFLSAGRDTKQPFSISNDDTSSTISQDVPPGCFSSTFSWFLNFMIAPRDRNSPPPPWTAPSWVKHSLSIIRQFTQQTTPITSLAHASSNREHKFF